MRGQGRLPTNRLPGSLPTLPPPFSFPPRVGLRREREREGGAEFSPRRNKLPKGSKSQFFGGFFCFVFFLNICTFQHIYTMYISRIFTICTYLHIYTTSPHLWAWWCTCGKALSQPRQHPSNKTE